MAVASTFAPDVFVITRQPFDRASAPTPPITGSTRVSSCARAPEIRRIRRIHRISTLHCARRRCCGSEMKGIASHWAIYLSVHPSVCLSVRPFIRLHMLLITKVVILFAAVSAAAAWLVERDRFRLLVNKKAASSTALEIATPGSSSTGSATRRGNRQAGHSAKAEPGVAICCSARETFLKKS